MTLFRKVIGSTFAAASFLLAATLPAAAAPMTASEILNTYNLVVFGDANIASHVDGRAFVTGDLTSGGGTAEFGNHYSELPASAAQTLTVLGDVSGRARVLGGSTAIGGNVATNMFEHNATGDMYVGGNLAGNVTGNFNGKGGNLYAKGSVTNGANVNANGGTLYLGGTVQSGNANGAQTNSPLPASVVPDVSQQAGEMKSTMTKYSSYLATLEKNSDTSKSGSRVTFTATPDENGLAIFTIADAKSFFASAGEFDFALNGATSVVINVLGGAGEALNISYNFLGNFAQLLATKAIWNFVDATEIVIDRTFGGSILALLAHVTNQNANIEGTLIAGSLTQRGEIHYNGNINVPVSQTPIPAALPLFGAALAGLAYAGRMRTKRRERLAA